MQIEISKRNINSNDSIDDISFGEFLTSQAVVNYLESVPAPDLWLYYITIWDGEEFVENVSAEEWVKDHNINKELVRRGIL